MQLARIPFHLNNILTILSDWPETELAFILDGSPDLEAKLVDTVVCGKDKALAAERQKEWRKLAVAVAQGRQASIVKELIHLSRTDLVQDIGQFSHDLIFEYGLISHWQSSWQICEDEDITVEFWKKLANLLKFTGAVSTLMKWYTLNKEKLYKDLEKIAAQLVQEPVFESIRSLAVIMQDQQLLTLVSTLRPFSKQLDFRDPGILLAIQHDLPQVLEGLLRLGREPHHPEAGRLNLREESAEYVRPRRAEFDLTSSSSHSSRESSDVERSRSERSSASSTPRRHEIEESDDEQQRSIKEFVRNPSKYWSAGFDELEGYTDDEGMFVENPRFEQPPSNDQLYLHQCVLNDSDKALLVLVKKYREMGQRQMLNLVNSSAETPLHLAALKAKLNSLRVLIEQKARLNAWDKWKETPLHNSVYAGSVDGAKLLLDAGADIDPISEEGLTPLHIAIMQLNWSMTELLLTHGANLEIHPFQSNQISLADLLDQLPREKQKEMEEFVLQLIECLGFEGEQVNDLMTLVEHRAQINDSSCGFDYVDEETELEHVLDWEPLPDRLDDLSDYILSDSENIQMVLEHENFKDLREELIEGWFEQANEEEYQNLKAYLESIDDQEMLKKIRGDKESQYEDALDWTGDKKRLEGLTSYILEDPNRIQEVLEKFEKDKKQLVIGWLKSANPQERQNLETYAKDSDDEEVLKLL